MRISKHVERMDVWPASDKFQVLGAALANCIAGLYAFKESGSDPQLTPTLAVSDNVIDVENKSYSVFGQVTYAVLQVEGLSPTGGVRQTWDKREMTSRSKRVGGCRLTTVDVGGVPLNPRLKTSTPSGFSAGNLGAPRTFGVEARYDF